MQEKKVGGNIDAAKWFDLANWGAILTFVGIIIGLWSLRNHDEKGTAFIAWCVVAMWLLTTVFYWIAHRVNRKDR